MSLDFIAFSIISSIVFVTIIVMISFISKKPTVEKQNNFDYDPILKKYESMPDLEKKK